MILARKGQSTYPHHEYPSQWPLLQKQSDFLQVHSNEQNLFTIWFKKTDFLELSDNFILTSRWAAPIV